MRINVYSQELTKEVKLVCKVADTGIVHHGVRIYFASSPLLHNTEADDDRSAITYWIPNCGSFSPEDLAAVFRRAAGLACSLKLTV